MKILLKHYWRLGDIVRIFPIAAHLASQKHEVFIECAPKFASILKLIDYAKWHDPKGRMVKSDLTSVYDAVYNLAIWPGQAYRYRITNPPMRLLDFVAAGLPDMKGMNRAIVFSELPPIEPILKKYGLPAQYSLACPVGFNNSNPDDHGIAVEIDFDLFETWLNSVIKPRGDVFLLAHPGFPINRRFVTVEEDNLHEMAALIANAIDFATILSAPAVIASGRVGKKPIRESWHHLSPVNPRERAQDDIVTKEQIRWEVDFNAASPRIVKQKT